MSVKITAGLRKVLPKKRRAYFTKQPRYINGNDETNHAGALDLLQGVQSIQS